jgi:hypothetical protein
MSEPIEMNEQEREVYRIAKAKAMRELLDKSNGYYGAVVNAVADDRAKRAVLAQRVTKREAGR